MDYAKEVEIVKEVISCDVSPVAMFYKKEKPAFIISIFFLVGVRFIL